MLYSATFFPLNVYNPVFNILFPGEYSRTTKQYARTSKSGNAPLFSSRDLKAFEGLVRPSTNFSKGARALEDPYE